MSASTVILDRMQAHPSCDSLNISRRFAVGASNLCLVGENPTYVLRPDVLGVRGCMVIRLRPCMTYDPPPTFFCCRQVTLGTSLNTDYVMADDGHIQMGQQDSLADARVPLLSAQAYR